MELNPHDFDANFEIAAIFEDTDAKRALVYYEQGVRIMRDHIESGSEASNTKFKFMQLWPASFESAQSHRELSQKTIPPEILNNLAVLLQKEDKDGEAKKLYEEALSNCDKLIRHGKSQ